MEQTGLISKLILQYSSEFYVCNTHRSIYLINSFTYFPDLFSQVFEDLFHTAVHAFSVVDVFQWYCRMCAAFEWFV